MMGVRLTPNVDHNTITLCKEAIIFFQRLIKGLRFPKILQNLILKEYNV